MKRRLLGFLLIGGLMLHSVFPICGQQIDPIDRARQQIQLLEAVDKDPTTSPEAKSINRRFLRERRLQLQGLLTKAIAGLRDYQARVGSSLTRDESEAVENSIRSFEKSLQELKDAMQMANSSEFPTSQISALATASSATRSTPPFVDRGDSTRGQTTVAPDSTADSNPATNSTTAGSASNSSPAIPASLQADCAIPIPTGGSACYPSVPKIIECDIDRIARQAAQPGADVATAVTSQFDTLFLETVVDAFSNSSAVNIRQLTAYQYIGETARTDKQIGSPTNSKGSTSAAEKPGWADILGFAVERGAIQQAVSGTTLTLSTTPYAFFVPTENDTAAAYSKYGNYRRLALTATFNISNQDSPLSNARRQSLSNYSVKVRVSPDRSPRSKTFQERWHTDIKPTIQKDLALVGGNIKTILKQPGVRKYVDEILDGTPNSKGLIDEVEEIAGSTTKTAAQKQTEIKAKILCALDDKVFKQTKEDNSGLVKIDSATRTKLLNEFIPALFEAQAERVRASEAVQKIFDDLDKKWMGTLAYTNNRAATGSTYSQVKFLFQNYIGESPIKMVANAGFSLYHNPDPLLHQQRLRDFAAAFSFEGKRDSPFIKDPLDKSQMTFSLTGRYERMLENRGIVMRTPDIGIVQFKLDFPIGQGMSIPLSLTYANATEQQKEQHVRGNFGFTLDADKFLILRRLLQH
jgi:ElaB/YqjD/DUF883 family membrane-anchored ribosome-binding protein